jgi:chromate reductase
MTKLLCMAASFRTESTNKKLLTLAANIAQARGAEITALDYRDTDCPALRDDKPVEPLPAGVQAFSSALHACDGMILAVPEYNWSIPGAFKNLIDWLSVDASLPLKSKTALLLCATPSVRGGITGLLQLRVPLEHLGVWVYPHCIGIGRSHETITESGLTEAKEQEFMVQVVSDFVAKTTALVTSAPLTRT